MTYDTSSIRKFLTKQFSSEDVTALCFDYFPAVYEDVNPAMTKSSRIQHLIAFARRNGRLETLLRALEKERPALYNRKTFTKKAMVRVAAGEFLFGKNDDPMFLEEFWIDKTPVTNKEYAHFVANKPYKPPQHWINNRPPAEIADHPVVHVSWLDAKAYADWAGMQLPSEEQWEKAARGVDGRIYPWGNRWRDGCCNTREAGIVDTSPVGQFSPQGDSPFGCVDMSGNVWEWMRDWYGPARKNRVLHGGSWQSYHKRARLFNRYFNPEQSSNFIGFRLVAFADAAL